MNHLQLHAMREELRKQANLQEDLPWYTTTAGATGGTLAAKALAPKKFAVPAQIAGALAGTAAGLEGGKWLGRKLEKKAERRKKKSVLKGALKGALLGAAPTASGLALTAASSRTPRDLVRNMLIFAPGAAGIGASFGAISTHMENKYPTRRKTASEISTALPEFEQKQPEEEPPPPPPPPKDMARTGTMDMRVKKVRAEARRAQRSF